jgi:hypothetical protein
MTNARSIFSFVRSFVRLFHFVSGVWSCTVMTVDLLVLLSVPFWLSLAP